MRLWVPWFARVITLISRPIRPVWSEQKNQRKQT